MTLTFSGLGDTFHSTFINNPPWLLLGSVRDTFPVKRSYYIDGVALYGNVVIHRLGHKGKSTFSCPLLLKTNNTCD